MSIKERLMQFRERAYEALLGRANVELDRAHRRESAERLRPIDERLDRLDRTVPREIAEPDRPVANGSR